MTERIFAPAAMATLLGFATTAAVSADAPMNADQGWSAISRCAQEDTERARHLCVDRVLREAGLLTNAMDAQQQRRVFGLDDKARSTPAPKTSATASAATNDATATGSSAAPAVTSASPAATAATAPPVASRRSNDATREASTPQASINAAATAAGTRTAPAGGSEPIGPADPDRLDVELTKVDRAANGRLVVTTNDGAVWLQTESVSMPLPPAAGDHMSIRKGALGGYRCTVASTKLTYRCIRNK